MKHVDRGGHGSLQAPHDNLRLAPTAQPVSCAKAYAQAL